MRKPNSPPGDGLPGPDEIEARLTRMTRRGIVVGGVFDPGWSRGLGLAQLEKSGWDARLAAPTHP